MRCDEDCSDLVTAAASTLQWASPPLPRGVSLASYTPTLLALRRSLDQAASSPPSDTPYRRAPSHYTRAALQTVADFMDKPAAKCWLEKLAYMQSEQGFPAIVETLKHFMLMLGADDRVTASSTVRGADFVDCTVGHFSIVCAIVQEELEKAAGIKPQGRTGLSGGIYTEFSAEVPRADRFLPIHNAPARGLRLIDGGDEYRGQLDADESPELLEEKEIDVSALEAGIVDPIEDAQD